MALSKKWTLFCLISDVKALISSDFPNEKVLDLEIRDFLNLALQEVATKLSSSSAPDYGEVKIFDPGTITDNIIDISDLNFDSIIKLVNDLYGIVPEKPFGDNDNLARVYHYKHSRFYSRFGEKLFLFIGDEITEAGVYSLFYYRLPEYMVEDTDFIDIKDKYVPLVVTTAKAMILEKLGLTQKTGA